ncbi:MAG: trypsin-like peptidase domain-containing protein [Flavobacteriales bacterium]
MAVTCLTAAVLSGCASVLGTAENNTTVDSTPSGAMFLLNGEEVGTAPYTYTYNSMDGEELVFEVRKTGYVNGKTELRIQRNNGILLADAMLFHIPYAFDKNHPNMYRFPKRTVMVDLLKEMPTDLEKFLLPVTGLENKTGEHAPAGIFNRTKITTGNPDVFSPLKYPEELAGSVVRGLRDTWVDANFMRRGSTVGDEAVRRAKIFLYPALLSVTADLRGLRNNCIGTLAVEVDWRFYSAAVPDSLLHSFATTTTYNASAERTDDLLDRALILASRRMLDSEGLYERLRGFREDGVILDKGVSINLPIPTPIAFTGRKDMLSELLKAVATVETSDGHGSGFLITNNGYIITNEHVVGIEKSVKVRFSQGFTLGAEVVKVNKDFDLVLLKANVDDMPALSIGADSALLVGEEIFAIGTPLDKELGQTVSRGILSGKREFDGHHYLQTDVSINPGNSGGPFIDETGKVVGVATLKLSGKGLEGLGFGVPISNALEMLNITMKK